MSDSVLNGLTIGNICISCLENKMVSVLIRDCTMATPVVLAISMVRHGQMGRRARMTDVLREPLRSVVQCLSSLHSACLRITVHR